MNQANWRLTAACTTLLFATLFLSTYGSEAYAQSRRKSQEPPPVAEPLPEIGGEGARCSFAYHDALAKIGAGRARQLVAFESEARIVEPGLTGKWLFWIKTAKGAKPPATEQVCLEQGTRAGRQRCLQWETRPIEAALVGALPTADELAVLRGLDSFVIDKGAVLEFGSNGRQFVTLQRVAGEIASYSTQSRHPALCNGVPEMLEFHAGNLAGVKKRGDAVAELAARAIDLARQRVNSVRQQRMVEARAFNAALLAAPPVSVAATEGEGPPKAAAKLVAVPNLAPVPADADASKLVLLALEGTLSPEQMKALEGETSALGRLRRAREQVSAAALPAVGPAARAAAGAALRMVEAAAYGELQIARVKHFEVLFLGTADQIREAHRANCNCGN